MGQYHYPVNFTARQSLMPHRFGAGLKAWEQLAGAIPGALAALLAHNPGNGPADLGHHPKIGAWAGHRLAMIGDYAEDGDIPGYEGTPLSEVYGLCREANPPFEHRWGKEEDARKEWQEELDTYQRLLRDGPQPFEDISRQLIGLIEEALSVRYCGRGWRAEIPVLPRARRDADGKLHYDIKLPKNSKEKKDLWGYFMRCLGFPEATQYPEAVNLERWPWDRPPADLAWDNITDAEIDAGQTRVFANLTKREFIDPMKFGEVATTAGIIRASDQEGPARLAMDFVISGAGVQKNVKEGGSNYGSASAVFAMLLHPESRGGGDIDSETFSEIGRWRYNELVLTSEYGGDFPSTDEIKNTFTDISDTVLQALAKVDA